MSKIVENSITMPPQASRKVHDNQNNNCDDLGEDISTINAKDNTKKSSNIQTQSIKTKTATHFTIVQQIENKKPIANKNNIDPSSGSLKLNQKKNKKLSPDRAFKKLHKQSEKVKSLEQEYRDLQDQLSELKQAINLQLQLIKHDTQKQIIQQTKDFNSIQRDMKKSNKQPFYLQQRQPQTVSSISSELLLVKQFVEKIFSHHENIRGLSSNYLIENQINEQNQKEFIFCIKQLEERIDGLRFLLNTKQDLLAYEIATFGQGTIENADNEDEAPRVLINYHVPKRATLLKSNQMQDERQFIEKIVLQYWKLNKNVKKLQKQLQGNDGKRMFQTGAMKSMPKNEIFNEINKLPEKQEAKIQKFKQTSVNILENVSKQVSTLTSTYVDTQNGPIKLSLLPFSIENFRQSLIYKVGKLYQDQQFEQKALYQKYNKLTAELKKLGSENKDLRKQYEIKRDILRYKKRNLTKEPIQKVGNVLDDLDTDDLVPSSMTQSKVQGQQSTIDPSKLTSFQQDSNILSQQSLKPEESLEIDQKSGQPSVKIIEFQQYSTKSVQQVSEDQKIFKNITNKIPDSLIPTNKSQLKLKLDSRFKKKNQQSTIQQNIKVNEKNERNV